MLEIAAGSHAIHLYDLVLSIDPEVLVGVDFAPSQTGEGASRGLFQIIEVAVADPAQPGMLALTATMRSDPARAIQRTEQIATVRLRAVGPIGTESTVAWQLCDPVDSRCGSGTVLRSLSAWDQGQENGNVLGAAEDAIVEIVAPG